MNRELVERVKRGFQEGKNSDEIKSELANAGFIEDDISEVILEIHGVERTTEERKNTTIFTFKELFDRIGYGFSSVQFINILFYLTGASFFLIGLVNGLKVIFSILLSSYFQEYSKIKRVSAEVLSRAGVFFGLSFLFLGLGIAIKNVWLFALSLIIGSIGVVTYGDFYEQVSSKFLKKEKLGTFLLRISYFGVVITGLGLILSGFIFDRFSIYNPIYLNFYGKTVPIYGYLICFEITAIAFILSGYLLHFLNDTPDSTRLPKSFVKSYFIKIKEQALLILKNKYLLLLLLASSITGLVQILGTSYYGIFIFQKFQNSQFDGIVHGVFLNIAIIFLFAIFVSFLGPSISNSLNRKVGLAPSMVFGSLLVAMMPLVCIYNPHFLSITVANAMSILGSAILGLGQGLIVRKLLKEEQRSAYYSALGIVVVIPFLILIPSGAFIAQNSGLESLFKFLGLIMLVLAAPIYFALVAVANKQRL